MTRDQEIADVLLHLRMLSDAPASRFPDSIAESKTERRKRDEKGRLPERPTLKASHSKHRESAPPFSKGSEADYWRDRFKRAEGNDQDTLDTLLGAREALIRAHKSPDPRYANEDYDDRTNRILKQGKGLTPREAAAKYPGTPVLPSRSVGGLRALLEGLERHQAGVGGADRTPVLLDDAKDAG